MKQSDLVEHRNLERNKDKLPICRITSLKGFGGVIIGRDIGGIFKDGHVYSAKEIMGVIVIEDLGEHAIPKYYEGNRIIYSHTSGVPMLTKKEYKKEKEAENE